MPNHRSAHGCACQNILTCYFCRTTQSPRLMRTEHARVTSPRKHPTNILRTLHLRHFYASSTMPKECAKWSVHRQANLDSFSLRHGMRQARCCKRLLATPYDGPPVVSLAQRENQQQRQQQQKQHPQQQQHRRQRRTTEHRSVDIPPPP